MMLRIMSDFFFDNSIAEEHDVNDLVGYYHFRQTKYINMCEERTGEANNKTHESIGDVG